MTAEGHALALARLDYAIESAEAEWGDSISEQAVWPQEAAFSNKDSYYRAVDAFHKYLCGDEARNISRLLFQLKSAPVDTVEKMDALIDAHNAQIEEDTGDGEYPLRTGVGAERLRQAAMVTEGEREILLSAVSRYGPGVIHERGYARLLVRISNHNRVNAAVNVLTQAGFVEIRRGANNAKLVVSNGALEDAHAAYLKAVCVAAQARLP